MMFNQFTMPMKKTLLTFLLAMLTIAGMAQTPQSPYLGQQLPISVYIIKQTGATFGHPHAPAKMPTVTIDGNTIHFYDAHPSGYDVWLEDSDGNTVYTTFVSSSDDEMQLPSTLSGTYIMYIEDDNFIYCCEVTL